MSTSDDHYTLLGLTATATTEELRNSYKEKALLHHPDRGGDPFLWSNMQRAYDTLSDPQRRAVYDRTKRGTTGGAEQDFAQKFGEGAFDLSEAPKVGERKAEPSMIKGALATSSAEMSHNSGFEAWLRNQKGVGKHGFYNAEDLLRQSKARGGGIEATDASSVPLPPLTTLGVSFESHGVPEEVLRVERELPLPSKLAHGEVLVHMLAACVNDEDLVRVQSSLAVLNEYPPFNRMGNKWEAQPLPAVAGVEGVGVVLATAKNVPGLAKGALEVKDWVIALPEARLAPVGTWRTLCVCDSARLLKVPAQLLPLQHLACSRALCTAYRLLEDYGGLKPGDTLIQNAADLPTGQAVVQLCKLLKIRTINLVQDDDAFERTKELLKQLGATIVLRDNNRLNEFLSALGSEMPRLGLDALGGENGKRMAIALRPEATLVIYSLEHGRLPALSPSLLMYQQISLHGFSLPQWVSEEGPDAYLGMLTAIAELVAADKLSLFTRTQPAAELTPEALQTTLKSHRAMGGETTVRQRSVLLFGDEATANNFYFEVAGAIRRLQEQQAPDADAEALPLGSAAADGGPAKPPPQPTPAAAKKPKASERWADAAAMLRELKLEQYVEQFEEEEMTSLELLEDIVNRGDGEKELMDALKEMGIKKMGHRQAIVGAVVGKL